MILKNLLLIIIGILLLAVFEQLMWNLLIVELPIEGVKIGKMPFELALKFAIASALLLAFSIVVEKITDSKD